MREKNVPLRGRTSRSGTKGHGRGEGKSPSRSQNSRDGNQIKKISVALVLSLLLWPATAAAWSGKVVGVVDGITVLHNGRGEQIRLWGIDCPENSQDFGAKAKHATSILVFAKVVEVEPVTTDRYGRTVAFARVGDILVNEELIRQGLAWVFTRCCDRPICEQWERSETEARSARRGLWSMSNAIPPWEFRRSRR